MRRRVGHPRLAPERPERVRADVRGRRRHVRPVAARVGPEDALRVVEPHVRVEEAVRPRVPQPGRDEPGAAEGRREEDARLARADRRRVDLQVDLVLAVVALRLEVVAARPPERQDARSLLAADDVLERRLDVRLVRRERRHRDGRPVGPDGLEAVVREGDVGWVHEVFDEHVEAVRELAEVERRVGMRVEPRIELLRRLAL
mmetsp:Transcript_34919/g.105290  ORF Transcript_34919/g.105290 Transcript_34919/m.105290 type:complete len:202 (+) Transcript_34919:435-1040(+)